MKVMHIGQLIGGLDVYIRNSISYSSNKNFDFVVVHGRNDNNKPIMCGEKQAKEYWVDLCRSINPINDIKCLLQIIRIIKDEKPDILHCHSAKGGFIGRIAGFLTGIKTFYTPHAFSFLCTSSRLKRNIFLILERCARLNSYLLACSESEKQMGIKIVGYCESHAKVWHNSVPDASLRHGDINVCDKRFITYIGRPSYQKNPFFLLEVIKEVVKRDATLKFYLLGVGYYSPDLEAMKQKIKEYNINDNIVLMPWLNHDDCLEFVRKSIFYITCSLYEGLPLSVIEAMSLGKAIIASDVIGNNDCVMDGKNGFLLPLNVHQFADCILELANNEEKRILLERFSRNIFLEKFLIDNQIEELHQIYKNCRTC